MDIPKVYFGSSDSQICVCVLVVSGLQTKRFSAFTDSCVQWGKVWRMWAPREETPNKKKMGGCHRCYCGTVNRGRGWEGARRRITGPRDGSFLARQWRSTGSLTYGFCTVLHGAWLFPPELSLCFLFSKVTS